MAIFLKVFFFGVNQAQSRALAFDTLQRRSDALADALEASRQAAASAAAAHASAPADGPELSQAIASAAEAQVLAQLEREVEARTGPLVRRCADAEQQLRGAKAALAKALQLKAAASASPLAAERRSPPRRSGGDRPSEASKREDWVRASAMQACVEKLRASEALLSNERDRHAAAMAEVATGHEAELASAWQGYQAAAAVYKQEMAAEHGQANHTVATLQLELRAVNERAAAAAAEAATAIAKYLSAWREAEVRGLTRNKDKPMRTPHATQARTFEHALAE
jgi:hypothetical protein